MPNKNIIIQDNKMYITPTTINLTIFTYGTNIISTTVICLNIGTPKIINFPFGTNGKLSILGVPIFKHIRVPFSKLVLLGILIHYSSVSMSGAWLISIFQK